MRVQTDLKEIILKKFCKIIYIRNELFNKFLCLNK